MKRRLACLIAFFGLFALEIEAKVFIGAPPPPLLDYFLEAHIVVVGRFHKAVPPDNALPYGQVELIIDEVLLPHAFIKDQKTVIIPHYMNVPKGKYVIAMEVYKGKLDPYRGVEVDEKGDVIRYVRGALQLKDKSPLGRARHAVGFLRSRAAEVADSAHSEVNRVTDADLRKFAAFLDPKVMLAGIQDKTTSSTHRATFGRLLGYCGKKEHAVALRRWLDDCEPKDFSTDCLCAFAILEPKLGLKYVDDHLTQKEPFLRRYAAYRVLHTLGDERRDFVDAAGCARRMARLLDMPDMCDFAMESLRKWQRWEYCDAVLGANDKFGKECVRKAALRFAIECPLEKASAFVQAQRLRDPEFVAETEELLAFEREVNEPKK